MDRRNDREDTTVHACLTTTPVISTKPTSQLRATALSPCTPPGSLPSLERLGQRLPQTATITWSTRSGHRPPPRRPRPTRSRRDRFAPAPWTTLHPLRRGSEPAHSCRTVSPGGPSPAVIPETRDRAPPSQRRPDHRGLTPTSDQQIHRDKHGRTPEGRTSGRPRRRPTRGRGIC